MATSKRPPLSPKEGWMSDGRQVLQFKPVHWDRWSQRLELITGELLPDQPVPLLKHRMELTREQAITLWRQKRQGGVATLRAPVVSRHRFAVLTPREERLVHG